MHCPLVANQKTRWSIEKGMSQQDSFSLYTKSLVILDTGKNITLKQTNFSANWKATIKSTKNGNIGCVRQVEDDTKLLDFPKIKNIKRFNSDASIIFHCQLQAV